MMREQKGIVMKNGKSLVFEIVVQAATGLVYSLYINCMIPDFAISANAKQRSMEHKHCT